MESFGARNGEDESLENYNVNEAIKNRGSSLLI